MHHASKKTLHGLKKCVKIWLLNVKRATWLGEDATFGTSWEGLEMS
jgi:hypothetical protein